VKEVGIGIGNGLVTGAIAAVVAWIMNGDPSLGVILALAMVINLFVAGLAGTLIPLGLKALKIDPALASAVFITTFTDVAGFASFLGLATLFTRYFQRAG
jgi:magnesium transporter